MGDDLIGLADWCRGLGPVGYELLSEGERHGSYELVWGRNDEAEGLSRFVVVAITPDAPTSSTGEPLIDVRSPEAYEDESYRVEVWAGASTLEGQAFVREVVARWDAVTLRAVENEHYPYLTGMPAAEIDLARKRAESHRYGDVLATGIARGPAISR